MAKAEYRSVIRSKKMINAALADLLMEKPLDKITVTELVRRADINRGTFYAHYKDIPDVVEHLIRQTFSVLQDAMISGSAEQDQVAHTLLCTLQVILSEDLVFYRKILNSNAAAILQERLVEVVSEFMLEHRERFYRGSPEEYQLAIRFCAGGLSNLYRDWFDGKLPYTLEELTQVAEALVCKMIGG